MDHPHLKRTIANTKSVTSAGQILGDVPETKDCHGYTVYTGWDKNGRL